jgi:hypothetical protein
MVARLLGNISGEATTNSGNIFNEAMRRIQNVLAIRLRLSEPVHDLNGAPSVRIILLESHDNPVVPSWQDQPLIMRWKVLRTCAAGGLPIARCGATAPTFRSSRR